MWWSPDNSMSFLCVPRARHYAYDKIRDLLFKYSTPKLGIKQINMGTRLNWNIKFVSGRHKRPLKESIDILHNYGPGVRGMKA